MYAPLMIAGLTHKATLFRGQNFSPRMTLFGDWTEGVVTKVKLVCGPTQ